MKEVLNRSEIKEEDKWNLDVLCTSKNDFEKKCNECKKIIEDIQQYKGKVTSDEKTFLTVMKLYNDAFYLADITSSYAQNRTQVDQSDEEAMELSDQGGELWSQLTEKIDFVEQEIFAADEDKIRKWSEEISFASVNGIIKDILYNKKNHLSESEERIMSLNQNCSSTSEKIYNKLINKSIDFGTVTVDGKEVQLTPNNWYNFLKNPDRDLRKKVYMQYHKALKDFEDTFALIYSGVIKQNVFAARARGFDTALDKSMFFDHLDKKILDSLIEAAHRNREIGLRYRRLTKKLHGYDKLYPWDTSMPVFEKTEKEISFDDAVEILFKALEPLGKEYTDVLRNGINNRWIDKYDNLNKANTSFCSPTYGNNQLVMLHFTGRFPRDVFTIAHECGHAMHSYLSAKNVAYCDFYPKSIDAETASTFNEQLLFRYLNKTTEGQMKKEILYNKIRDLYSYMFGQVVLTEYELKCHQQIESGKALSVKFITSLVEDLDETYSGNVIEKTEYSSLGYYDVPHFYFTEYPYYNYKYAVSYAASFILEEKIHQDPSRLPMYLDFLKSGGKFDTVENLSKAGVDITDSSNLDIVYKKLNDLMDELEAMI